MNADWRRVLRAVRAARTAGADFGPRTAARAAAVELSTASHTVRLAARCVLASQSAKNAFQTDLGTLNRELDAADALRSEMGRTAVPRRTVQRVRGERLPVETARAVPILDLFRRYGHQVRRAGAEWATICPFHNDRRPSLRVNAGKAVWRCHVCGIGGDGIAFVMLKKSIDFATAVREVAA